MVRRPSKNLHFETVLKYNKKIFNLSYAAPKLKDTMLNMMPLFRIPVEALADDMIPPDCYVDEGRSILNVKGKSLAKLRTCIPRLAEKYKNEMSAQRSARHLTI